MANLHCSSAASQTACAKAAACRVDSWRTESPGWSAGFTLVELMVGLAILAIVLGLAAPSFVETIERDRGTAGTGELIHALNIARSEALKRRRDVVVCRRNADGDACSDGTEWTDGWIVATLQPPPASELDDPDDVTVIQVWGPTQATTLVGPKTGVVFEASGMVAAAAQFTVPFPNCQTKPARELWVTAAGTVKFNPSKCPSP